MTPINRLLATALFCLPVSSEANTEVIKLDLTQHWVGYCSLTLMVMAYITAMLEEVTFLRKSKPMLLAAGLLWALIIYAYQQQGMPKPPVDEFKTNLLTYAELMFFILVSMTYLNVMDKMRVFDALRNWLENKGMNYRQLFWVTGLLVFFMSFFLNGLTTGLLMGSVVLAVGKHNARFISLACINIVIAANAGGSVSPLGGISTLFVWQHGMLQFTDFFNLFVPCLVNYLVPACMMQFAISKESPMLEQHRVTMQRGAKRVVVLFVVTIALAVWSDMSLHMPAAFGMMFGLSLLNLFNYYLQQSQKAPLKSPEELFSNLANSDLSSGIATYQKYDITDEVGDLDWDTLLFFYGTMMGIGGLGYIGYLDLVSHSLYGQLSPTLANILIGLSSAFIDNGTLMFAILTMHPDISQGQWLLLSLTLGVGGSLLAIGSAPGIGLLGLAKDKYTFSEHMKWFPAILLGYFASIGVHFLINARFF